MRSRSHLSIGEVLSLLQDEFPDVTISKIRFLESQGLLDPERTPSGYRKFYDADLRRLRYILGQQRDHFLPLKVIKERLAAGAHLPPPGEAASTDAPSGSPVPVDAEGADGPAAQPAGAPANGSEPLGGPSGADDAARRALADAAGDVVDVGTPVPARATIGEGFSAGPAGGGPTAGPAVAEPSGAGAGDTFGEPAAAVPERSDVDVPTMNGPVASGPGGGRGPRSRPAEGDEQAGVDADGPDGPSATAEDDPGHGEGGHGSPGTEPPEAAPAGRGFPGGGARRRDKGRGPVHSRTAGGSRVAATSARSAAGDLTSVSLSLTELAGATGLEVSELRDLERYGVVTGRRVGADTVYGDDALLAAQAAARFRRHGIEARHLRSYRMAADREAGLFEQVVAPQLRARNQGVVGGPAETLEELEELGESLRRVLVRQALRTLLDGS